MRQRGDLPVLEREPDVPRSAHPATLAPPRDRPDGSRPRPPIAPATGESMQPASWRTRRRRKIAAVLVICCVLLISGASLASAAQAPQDVTPALAPVPTPIPTATPWPTATPTPLPPPPLSVPPGWEVYRGHHFAVAYPPGWTYVEHIVQGSDGQVSEAAISFNSGDGSYSVGIAEREGLDATTLQQYCAMPGTPTTYAGLPMITSITGGTLRMYTFAAASGIAYTLLYRQDETSQDTLSLYDKILATFRPEVSASACG